MIKNNIERYMAQFENFFKTINNNKNILISILFLFGIYFAFFSENLSENIIYLFDNEIFKLILFILITFISTYSPAIGISLALIMLVSLQIITYLKLKKELDEDIEKIEQDMIKEKFSIEPYDMNCLSDEYLKKPLIKIDELSPPINFNLKYNTPNELSYEMIKKGKNLLNESYDLDQDNIVNFDSREKQISLETKKNGIELINSGLNRLQKSNQGEYNTIFDAKIQNKINGKFSKYEKLLNIPSSYNLLIKANYSELLNNYDLLKNSQLDYNKFNEQLKKVYKLELDLLETIYKLNKSSYDIEKKKYITLKIDKIKNSIYEEKTQNCVSELEELYEMLL